MAVADLKASAGALRKSASFARLGKKLFTKGALSLTPTDIATLLRLAGVPISKDAQIGLDVAQIMISGGAFVSNIENASALSSYMAPTASALQAATDLMILTGVMDKNSGMAQFLTIGSDSVLVVATGGANVLADLKLVMDVASAATSGGQIADEYAGSSLNDLLRERRKVQIDAWTRNYVDFNSKKISVFDLMALTAFQTPDYFPQFFPEYKMFFPMGYVQYYVETEVKDLFGSHTSHAEQWVKTTMSGTWQNIIDTIFHKLIEPALIDFKTFNDNEVREERISLKSLVVLSMLPPFVDTFRDDFNAFDLLMALDLTPWDLGERDLMRRNVSMADRWQGQLVNAAISINGTPTFNTNEAKTLAEYEERKKKRDINNVVVQRLIDADQIGDIKTIAKYQYDVDFLKKWGRPDFKAMGNSVLLGRAPSTTGTITQRAVRNYWAALGLLDTLKNDKWFQGINEQYDFIGTSNEIQNTVRELAIKSQCRKMNRQAMHNIAHWLGTTPDKLKPIHKLEVGQPAAFEVM